MVVRFWSARIKNSNGLGGKVLSFFGIWAESSKGDKILYTIDIYTCIRQWLLFAFLVSSARWRKLVCIFEWRDENFHRSVTAVFFPALMYTVLFVSFYLILPALT